MRNTFGHQKWWPGDTPFEIIIGAILTQNTAWTNVEKAISNLKKEMALDPSVMRTMPRERLAELIRPAGYFNVKSVRLKNFLEFFFKEYGGSIARMKRERGEKLRLKLLAVNGIGPETADSILLYALDKPFFVIDAYTLRIFTRHGLISKAKAQKMTYSDWQNLFMSVLPKNRGLFNDYHAQIVHTAKHFCKSSAPQCAACPLYKYL